VLLIDLQQLYSRFNPVRGFSKMKFRRLICLLIGLELSLAGIAVQGSYVVEADGMGIDRGAIATGADFDFVARDFGIEQQEAIQIALDNLRTATNLRGNLLLWSVETEDYSYYDDDVAGVGRSVIALDADIGDTSPLFSATIDSLPIGAQAFPPIDTNAIFWILRPTEFTSFSQLTAARFGFEQSE
jgi:hypothetical protein